MFLLITLFLVLVILIKILLEFRYSFNYVPLYIVTRLQGIHVKIASDLNDVKKCLKLSNKGHSIEELVATPAWSPILSIESVNTDKWQELKRNFMIFKKYLSSHELLSEIISNEMSEVLKKNVEIDSILISQLSCKIFTKWIFDYEMTSDELNQIYDYSSQYRKEIAVKQKGNVVKKRQLIDFYLGLIEKNDQIKSIFDSNWSKAEFYSVLLQPFIISPMINVSDIAVSVQKHRDKYDSTKDLNEFIDYCIFKAHPFPVLERYDETTNTQIFIMMDKLNTINDFSINYGHGPRACLGRLYAKEFLNSFFAPLLDYQNFYPKKNHFYSGRNNDNGNVYESIYQLKVFGELCAKILWSRIVKYFKNIS